jgi:hypothetical protein
MTKLLAGTAIGVAVAVRWIAQQTIFVGQVLIENAFDWWQWSEGVLNAMDKAAGQRS